MEKLKSLVFFLACLMLCLQSAQATLQLQSMGYWTNWQYSQNARGEVTTMPMNFTSQVSTASDVYGSSFQPLIADLDGDGSNELIISSGSYLLVYHTVSGNMHIDGQATLPSTQVSQGAVVSSDAGLQVVVPAANELMFYTYSSAGLALHNRYNLSAHNITGVSTGLVCTSGALSGFTFLGDTCLFATSNKRYAEYYVKTNTTASMHLGQSCANNPAVSTNFGGTRAALQCNNTYATIMIPYTLAKARSISIGQPIKQLAFYNTPAGGQDVLLVAYASTSVASIGYYDSLGTQKANANIHDYSGGTGCNVSFTTGKFSYDTFQVCAKSYSAYAVTATYEFACYNMSNMGLDRKINAANDTRIKTTSMLSIDADDDGYDELITPYRVYNLRKHSYFNFTTNTGGYMAVGDVNHDGNAEVIGTASGKTWVADSNKSLLAGLAAGRYQIIGNGRGLDQSPGSPVCLGSTVVFSAKDCSAWAAVGGQEVCNYVVAGTNDTNEYMFTTCGAAFNGLTYQSAGLPVANNPIVSCYYNVTGLYTFNVYLTTSMIGTDASKSLAYAIQLSVINGTPGPNGDCNRGDVLGTTLLNSPNVVAPSGTSQDVQGMFDILTGASSVIKIILVMIATIAMIIYLAVNGINNPIVHAGSIFCLWILCAMLGLFSFIYVVIYAVVIGLASAVFWVKGNAGG